MRKLEGEDVPGANGETARHCRADAVAYLVGLRRAELDLGGCGGDQQSAGGLGSEAGILFENPLYAGGIAARFEAEIELEVVAAEIVKSVDTGIQIVRADPCKMRNAGATGARVGAGEIVRHAAGGPVPVEASVAADPAEAYGGRAAPLRAGRRDQNGAGGHARQEGITEGLEMRGRKGPAEGQGATEDDCQSAECWE